MWLRLSLGHFGRQVTQNPVSQLKKGVSTSSLPPLIVDLLTVKDYPRSDSFFSMGILEGVKWKTSQAEQWAEIAVMKRTPKGNRRSILQ